MLAAALLPHPPVLVPALARGTAGDVADLLTACDTAVAELAGRAPSGFLLIGTGERTTRHRRDAWGTLAGFGVEVDVGRTDGGPVVPRLPLSLTLGRWLLDRAGWQGPVICQEVAAATEPAAAAALGREFAAETGATTAWLVLGDGEPQDGPLGTPLVTGDAPGVLAARTPAPGRAACQVMAGALGDDVRRVRAHARYAGAPLGTPYLVSTWWP